MKQLVIAVTAFVAIVGAVPGRYAPKALAVGAASEGVTVKLRSGDTFEGKLIAIDTTRLTIEVKGNKMNLLLEDVQSIEFQAAPSGPAPVQQTTVDPELPQEMTVWVVDGDPRFSKGVYHTRDCPYLTSHTPRPVRVKDLPPKSIPDDCVKRFRQSLQGKTAAFVDEAVKSSAVVPNTAPVVVPKPRNLGVTVEGYYALANGISPFEADSVLGVSGEEVSSSHIGDTTTETYVWKALVGGGRIIAIFQNDKLVSKSQSGLR